MLVHETLELARAHLWSPDNRTGSRYICNAISAAFYAGKFTADEAHAATEVVMHGVRRLSLIGHDYLRGAAVYAGLLPGDTTNTDPRYIAFRDTWLQQLIDEERTAAAHKVG